jgi:hypothetical protein
MFEITPLCKTECKGPREAMRSRSGDDEIMDSLGSWLPRRMVDTTYLPL